MHLTNFSLNKHSSKFIAPEGKIAFVNNINIIDDFSDESIASKRSLSNVYYNIKKQGKNVNHIHRKIVEVC